jgi:hypothetical protein
VGLIGSTRCSCMRELTPSFVKTVRRWYSTVRGLINSRAPISAQVAELACEGLSNPGRGIEHVVAPGPVLSHDFAERPALPESGQSFD